MARRLTFDFARSDFAAAAALALAVVVGAAVAISPWREAAAAWLTQEVPVRLGGWGETLTLRLWTRDGLMTLFFFGLGLELKSETARGELSSLRRLTLPVLTAVGGLAAATAAYAVWAGVAGAADWRGWPAVLGTDTTLVLALVALPPRIAPAALRSFVLAVAVTDNLVFLLVLALRRGFGVNAEALAAAAAALSFLALLSRWRAAPLALFAAGGATLWAATLRAGVDPSAAGFAAALMLPMRPRRAGERGLVERTRQALHPILAYGVAPAFVVCAVAPLVARPVGLQSAAAPGAAILAAALVVKAAGAVAACAVAARLGWARRPSGLSWRDVSAAAAASAISLTCGLYALVPAAGSADGGRSAVVLTTSLVIFAAASGLRLLAKPAPQGLGDGISAGGSRSRAPR